MRYCIMKKIIILAATLMLLVGCDPNVYKEDKEISKYAEEKKDAKDKKYFERMIKGNVKFLKCIPSADGKEMEATYTTVARDNDFPATIRFNYINKTYNVYFDNAYLNGPKDRLLKDIDGCFAAWEKLTASQSTWK